MSRGGPAEPMILVAESESRQNSTSATLSGGRRSSRSDDRPCGQPLPYGEIYTNRPVGARVVVRFRSHLDPTCTPVRTRECSNFAEAIQGK
jgi:hypothetical protein